MREFAPPSMQARDGLRAECLADPRKIWDAALLYTSERTRKGPDHAVRWAKGIFRGIYPNDWPSRNWGDTPPCMVDQNAYSLIDRETRRFRKNRRAA